MKNQPFLTDFPLHIFATAARKTQATLRRASEEFRRTSLSGYAVLFAEFLPASFLQQIDETKRRRIFDSCTVFWAWLAQILEVNASCSRGLSLIQAHALEHNLPAPSSSTSSYCQARLRLPVKFLQSIFDHLSRLLLTRVKSHETWRGFHLKALDGSSVQLLDTSTNQETYPQPSSQKEGCGFPVMGMVGLVNLAHGGWQKVITYPQAQNENIAARGLIAELRKGDLLLSDRGFCSYYLIAKSKAKGTEVFMRLNAARERRLDWSEGKKISKNERIVTWKRPVNPNKGVSKKVHESLPETLQIRLIKVEAIGRNGKKKTFIFATTLLDVKEYQAEDLAELYWRRWEIEVKLRDVKTTLNMELIAVKSPAMAHKALLMSLIAYNLIRLLMQQAAQSSGQETWQLSFKGVLDAAQSAQERFLSLAKKPSKRQKAFQEFIKLCASKRLNIRPNRSEPRNEGQKTMLFSLNEGTHIKKFLTAHVIENLLKLVPFGSDTALKN